MTRRFSIEDVKQMIHHVVQNGETPRTLILTKDDAQSLGLPKWTKQFLGLKVVIAWNMPASKVVSHHYQTIEMNTSKRSQEEKNRLI